MIKRISISVLAFLIGVAIAFRTESRLRYWIQVLFRDLSDDKIEFYGKNFHLFSPTFYYFSFAVLIVVFVLTKLNLSRSQAVKFIIVDIVTFCVTLVVICYLSSIKLVMECTACNNGIRRIHYEDIDYVSIILTSLAVAILPSGIHQIKRRMQRLRNTEQFITR